MFHDATFSINILKITLQKDSISVDRKKELVKIITRSYNFYMIFT